MRSQYLGQGDATKARIASRVDWRKRDGADGIGDRGMMEPHLPQPVRPHIPLKQFERAGLCLKGEYETCRSDALREGKRMRSDVGSNVEDGRARFEQRCDEFDFSLRPLSIEQERTSCRACI